MQAALAAEKTDAVLLTLLDSIAWLFNIRGGDIKHTPVALAFAIVPATGRPTLFIDPAKIGDNVKGEIRETADLAEPAALDGSSQERSATRRPASGSIRKRRRCGSRKR